jgi:hypothetical protein
MIVTLGSTISCLTADWPSYTTDLSMELRDPIKGSATRDGEACTLEQTAGGVDCSCVFRRASPGTYEIQSDAADGLHFRFQYLSANATVRKPSKGIETGSTE